MQEQGVGGGINFPGDAEPVLQVLQHCDRAHIGWVEATEN